MDHLYTCATAREEVLSVQKCQGTHMQWRGAHRHRWGGGVDGTPSQHECTLRVGDMGQRAVSSSVEECVSVRERRHLCKTTSPSCSPSQASCQISGPQDDSRWLIHILLQEALGLPSPGVNSRPLTGAGIALGLFECSSNVLTTTG